jgi:arylsulfatase A-like enzyme
MTVILAGAASCAPPERPRDLLFISWDTVRADHLDAYGYPRPTAPRLAELARAGWLFERAYSQSTQTGPSHSSMFTGLYPPHHGVAENRVRLPAEHRTLADLLRDDGWATGAFVSGWPMRAANAALDRGFEVYDDALDDVRRRGGETTERAIAWWRHAASRRRFLFVHLYDAHGPYEPSARLVRKFRSANPGPPIARLPDYQRTRDPFEPRRQRVGGQEYVDAYDASIRELDEQLARLLDEVDLRTTGVVVVADHGESLLERYWQLDHGGSTFEEQTRVPLVLAAPGLGAHQVEPIVELVDLLPTLLSLVGVSKPETLKLDGFDLLQVVRHGQPRPARAFSSSLAISKRHSDRNYRLDRDRSIHAMRTERLKVILYPGASEDYLEVYDLVADPGETQYQPSTANLAAAGRMRRILDRYAAESVAIARPQDLTAEDAASLRALGYLD